MSRYKDLAGQCFGRLTAIRRVENKGKHTRYLCRCDCGQEKIYYTTNLVKGLSTSCGCYRKENLKEDKLIDLTGQRYGRLTVIGLEHRDEDTRQYFWNCLCDCGNSCVVYGGHLKDGHLKDGHTSSCGCYNKERVTETQLIDLTGKKFGKLTVLRRVSTYYSPSGASAPIWLCQCDCGATVEITSNSLRRGTYSCGCVSSLGEELISSILFKHGIAFKKQYSFPDLRSNKNYKLYFDFCIIENDKIKCLIEFQGRQHFNYDENWKQSKDDFDAAQKRDELKRNYCKLHKIPLIEIPYWELSKIDYEYLKDKIESGVPV